MFLCRFDYFFFFLSPLYWCTGLCCQRSHWPPDDLCTVDRQFPVCDHLTCAQIHMCWCSIPKHGQAKKKLCIIAACRYSGKHIIIRLTIRHNIKYFLISGQPWTSFWGCQTLKLCLCSNIIGLNDSWLDVGSFTQEQFSIFTKVKLTAAQKDALTQDMSLMLMTGPDVSSEKSQLRLLTPHQRADLHLVYRAAPWVTESLLRKRGNVVDPLSVLEQVQFTPIMFDKWQKFLNTWAQYDKVITQVSRNYVDPWFGTMENVLNELDVFFVFLLPWWCGPLRQTQYIYHQSQPHWQRPGVPRGHGVGWCRSARPCPRQRWSGPWSRWPSGH